MRTFALIALVSLFIISSCTTEYHVSPEGSDMASGSAKDPFKTLSKAASEAMPGDVVIVHEGVYRERVNPPRGGSSDEKRITYRVAGGEKAEIKGSEIVTGWEPLGEGVWKVAIPNSLFGDHNPFDIHIAGDWLVDGGWNHTGEVYLNGASLFEATSVEGVFDPVPHERSLDQKAASYTWYAEVNDTETLVWANFQGADPNKEMTEVNVREACFYPDAPGRNYITIDGFRMSQAATQWAPPSAEQVGLIGTHWSKGWVIENCTIHDSKCSGITLGKDRKSGHNGWEPGTGGDDHYNKIIVKALEGSGWSKENIGSHIIRNNHIYDCEQTGICGSLGPVNSQVIDNHIHHIWTKRQFFGYEIGAIKFHAPIDVLIQGNRLHDAHKGMWMDWMTQGTRITGNLCYNNEMADLFAEVNHGPYLVDNNIFLSGIENWSESGAYVHNLIAGEIRIQKVEDRSTPFQEPHSTALLGLSTTTLGDDRYYNNIIIGSNGLAAYDQKDPEFPSQAANNLYFGTAVPLVGEPGSLVHPAHDAAPELAEKADGIYLRINLGEAATEMENTIVDTDLLGTSVRTGQAWENPDGSPLQIDLDYFGTARDSDHPSTGPIEDPGKGVIEVKVWESS